MANLEIKNAKMYGESKGQLSYVVFDIELTNGEKTSVNYWHNQCAQYGMNFAHYDLTPLTDQLSDIYEQITGGLAQ